MFINRPIKNKITLIVTFIYAFLLFGLGCQYKQKQSTTTEDSTRTEKSEQVVSNPIKVRTYLTNPKELSLSKSRIKAKDPRLAPSFDALMKHAQEALISKPLSVTQNDGVPPSGDKHDFYSIGRYWWSNPDTKDGLPYVRRDGMVNPFVLNTSDQFLIENFAYRLLYLSYAYYFTDDERFAKAAAENIRVWFINKDTRMNPHLNYAQGIPGRVNSRNFGVMDGVSIRHVIDAIGLIENSRAWNKDDHEAISLWMESYLSWLMTNFQPLKERNRENNHGTYYDVQITSIALFLGRNDIAADVCEMAKNARIKYQIMPDGTQPEELSRTNPFHYCALNLKGLCELAFYAERVGIDLWNFSTPDGRSIRKAADWLLPRLAGEIPLEHKETGSFYPQSYMAIFRLPSIKYHDAKYEQYWELFKERIHVLVFFDGPKEKRDAPDEQLDNLLYPRPDFTKEDMERAELDIKKDINSDNFDPFKSFPRVFLTNAFRLTETKKKIATGDERYLNAFKALIKKAEESLDIKPLTVTGKSLLAPSSDPHDYLSYSSKQDSTLVASSDHPKLDTLSKNVHVLAYAYYFSEDTRYAEHAARLLRTWFIDKDSKMNPHLNFAQIAPGTNIGSSFGITDAACLSQIVDAVGLLQYSKTWTRSNHEIFKEWTRQYVFWFLTSELGKEARKATDSLGLFADLQVLSLALCAGQYELAKRICEASKRDRIAKLIAPSGKIPAMLNQSQPLDYAARSLTALFQIALFAEEVNVDLWNYSTKSDRSLRKAADWFYSAISRNTEKVSPENYFFIFKLASEKFNEPKFEKFLNQIEKQSSKIDALNYLLYPPL